MAAHLQVLDQTFLWLLRASAQLAAVVIVVLLTRRALGGRISPGGRYALWLLLALPLLAPLLPKNPLRLPRTAPHTISQATATEPSPSAATPTRWRVIYEPLAPRAAPTVAGSHPLNWLRLGAWIWLTGA